MFTRVKVSIKDRIIYLVTLVFLTLDLTKSNVIWTSKSGYYVQILARIIACIAFAIITLLNLVDLSQKLKNNKNLYSKKQILKMIASTLIDFLILFLFILATSKNISNLRK